MLAKNLGVIQFSDCILNDVLKNYIYFLIGVYAVPELLDLMKRHRVKWLSFSAIVLVIGNVGIHFQHLPNVLPVKFALAVVGSGLVISIALLLPPFKGLSYVGKQTLPIYVLQGFAIAGTRLIMTKLQLNDSHGLLSLLVCTVCGITLPLASHWIAKHIWKLEAVFYPTKYIDIGGE